MTKNLIKRGYVWLLWLQKFIFTQGVFYGFRGTTKKADRWICCLLYWLRHRAVVPRLDSGMMQETLLKKLSLAPNQCLTLINSDYESAEITLFYNRDKSNNRTLVLASVEFLTKWHEKAPPVENECEKIPSSNGHEINFRRFHVNPIEALQWYMSADTSQVSIPFRVNNKIDLVVGKLAEEPRLPELVCEGSADGWDLLFCFGKRSGDSRWHYKRCMEPEKFDGLWSSTQREFVLNWILEKTNFDLRERQGLLGSLSLILPNPVFHHVGIRGSEQEGRVFLEIDTYPGCSPQDLSAIVLDQRPTGISTVQQLSTISRKNVIDFPSKAHQIGLAICCAKRGLLYCSPPTSFIESIQISMGIISGSRKVVVPKTKSGRDETQYTVSVIGSTMPIHVGSSSIPSGTLATSQEIMTLKTKKRGKSLDQMWFDLNEEKKAEEVIRDFVGKTQQELLIVDPYFGATELLRFALAVGHSTVPIRILSSRAYLNEKMEFNSSSNETRAELLKKNLDHVCAQQGVNRIEVRVLAGKKSIIHDRFLRSDTSVWLLGSSLYEFGSRGTMMIRVPDPDAVREKLEAAWNDSKTLEEFLQNKQATTTSEET